MKPQAAPAEQNPVATKPKTPVQAAKVLAEKLIGMSGTTPVGDSRSGARLGPGSVVAESLKDEKFANRMTADSLANALDGNSIVATVVNGYRAFFEVSHPETLRDVIHAAKTGKYQGEEVETSDDLYDVARRAMARRKK